MSQSSSRRKTPEEQARRSAKGYLNRYNGKAFEQEICLACSLYKARLIAVIDKTPEPMKILRAVEAGRFLCCFEKKAQPDFKGTMNDGTSVVFEAKYTESDSMKQDAVTDWQADELDKHARLGARCFVLAGFTGGRCYRIPWGIWRDMKAKFGKKSFTPEEAELYRVPTKNGIQDFLGLL